MAQPAQTEWTDSPAPASAVEPSDQFLSSLTAAMRRVADDARETSLADARAAIAAKIAAMRAAASARSEELRSRAEQDVAGIDEWSRAEIVRIESETQRKIEHRRAQLSEQLDEHDRRSSEAVAALEVQVEQYEGELALFFAQLGEITDPDTFIAAARRMPRLPHGEAEEPAAAPERRGRRSTDTETSEPHETRLRSLGIEHPAEAEATDGELIPTNGVHAEVETEPEMLGEAAPEPAPPAAEPAPAPASAAPAETALSDATTVVAAVGLGSFGAVTSFKTALEKTEGVSAVRLSLGTSGEFVYSVTHHSGLDLEPTVAASHPNAALHRGDDGVLHLNASKRR